MLAPHPEYTSLLCKPECRQHPWGPGPWDFKTKQMAPGFPFFGYLPLSSESRRCQNPKGSSVQE